MATCSNMADPVLLFQLPEMDVRLKKKSEMGILSLHTKVEGQSRWGRGCVFSTAWLIQAAAAGHQADK